MKKNFVYALMSAIALTGAVSLTSCSSSDDVIDNPDFNPEDNTVKTEFVINVTQPQERTRMASAVAGNGAFQGLNDMYLLSFTSAPGATSAIVSTQVHNLAGWSSSATPTPSLSGSVTSNSSKWYTLYLPASTSHFLFYGKTTEGDPTNNYATLGKLNYYVNKDAQNATITSVGDIQFSLSSIASSESTNLATAEATLAGYLNTIASTTNWAGSVTERDNTSNTAAVRIAYKALADAYQQFTSYSSSGYRQGSAKAILATVGDLHAAMANICDNESNTDVTDIAAAVKDNIEANFTIGATSAEFKATDLPTTTTNYPVAQGLPAGSAILKFDNGSFSYINEGTEGTATIGTPMANFTYPSELAYYCNSDLRATTSTVNTSNLPNTSVDWLDDDKWGSTWTQTAVNGNTRAVAMKDNVTFGVAQLQSTISLSSDFTTKKFTDNAAAVTSGDNITGNDIDNQVIDLSVANSYLKVTGVIIGGQPTTAGYDYLPTSTTTPYAIYDKIENTAGATGVNLLSASANYYTLVLDNYKTVEGNVTTQIAGQSPVNVAIEFVASEDFYGIDGLIKKDQPFYLIGALTVTVPTETTPSTIDWTKHVSFKSGDKGQGVDRVFIRDAKTTAAFKLKATSLQNAYSTIPDLRSTQMVFGLSVDLEWKPGLDYDITFGE